MGEKGDTPPTGTAIPRPRVRELGKSVLDEAQTVHAFDFTKMASSPPPGPAMLRFDDADAPPINPTIEDVYKLINARLSPTIVHKISSMPPPAPIHSIPVRAAKATGRWTKWAMAALGVLTLVGEIWADVEKYRGPISQLLVFAARQMDVHEAASPPELDTPEL